MKAFISKIFFCVFFLPMIFFMPQIVHAEKTDWADKSYNLKSVKRIVLLDVTSNVNLNNLGAVQYKIQSDYQDKSKKSKCTVITEEQARQMLNLNNMDKNSARNAIKNNIGTIADAWLECNISIWKDSYYIVPARTVWEDKRMTRRHRNSDGSTWEEVYYITVPVTYPPHRVDVSDISASFKVFGANNHDVIFARDDVRSRNDANAQKDMFGRMCNSFFEDFGKKVK